MRKNGFTLLEILVVLSILSTILLLTVPIQLEALDKQYEDKFIEQLQYDVLYIQNHASSINRKRIILFEDYYTVYGYWGPDFTERYYPKGWSLSSGDIRTSIQYAETGSLIRPRTITMYSETERIRIVFPLGKGRFYVAKEKRVLND